MLLALNSAPRLRNACSMCAAIEIPRSRICDGFTTVTSAAPCPAAWKPPITAPDHKGNSTISENSPDSTMNFLSSPPVAASSPSRPSAHHIPDTASSSTASTTNVRCAIGTSRSSHDADAAW
jgi:hypothetical protein